MENEAPELKEKKKKKKKVAFSCTDGTCPGGRS